MKDIRQHGRKETWADVLDTLDPVMKTKAILIVSRSMPKADREYAGLRAGVVLEWDKQGRVYLVKLRHGQVRQDDPEFAAVAEFLRRLGAGFSQLQSGGSHPTARARGKTLAGRPSSHPSARPGKRYPRVSTVCTAISQGSRAQSSRVDNKIKPTKEAVR